MTTMTSATRLGLLLTEVGYEVAEADNLLVTLRWLCAAPTGQVVLLDTVLLWRLNADLLLRAIARETSLERHHYVRMSGSDITRFATEAQHLITHRCTAVISKPFDIEQVLAVVAHAAALLLETEEGAGYYGYGAMAMIGNNTL